MPKTGKSCHCRELSKQGNSKDNGKYCEAPRAERSLYRIWPAFESVNFLHFFNLRNLLTRPDATARDTLGTAMYFITYESSKQLLTTFGGNGAHNNPFAVLVAGGMCGIVSWALICKLAVQSYHHVHAKLTV